MKKPLRIAQIGLEHDHAGVTLESIRKLTDDFEVIGYAEVNGEIAGHKDREKAVAGLKKYTVEELLNMDGLDAVTVETHDTQLAKYAIPFAEKGIPLHVDKPCGTDIASVTKLMETVKKNGTPFQTGYMYRFNPAVKKALEMKKNGEFGEIFSVECHMDCEHPASKREWLNTVPGGMMMFLGCHLTDLVLQFMGIPKSIECKSTSTHTDGVDSLDYGFTLYHYDNGLAFAKTCAREIDGFARRQLVITGTKATVEIYPLERYIHREGLMTTRMGVVTSDDTRGSWNDMRRYIDFDFFDRYDGMMQEFARIARREIVNPYTPDYELELYKAVIASCGLPLV